jgi:hypothetical protein
MKSFILLLSFSFYSVLGFAQDCASVNITGGAGQINITGLTGAPIIGVQVFNSGWASVFNQTYTNQPGNVSVPLGAGLYHVNVRFYNSNWGSICEKTADATVTSGTPQPADSCTGTFQKTAGLLAGNDQAFNIAKASDGNFIAVGQASASGTTNHDGLLMKLDSKGALLWSKTLGGAQHDFFTQIVTTADGGGLAAGRTNSGGISTYTGDVWFVRFDGNGNVVWQKRYFVAGNPGEVYTLISTSDGGFAFSGTFPFIAGPADWMVVKIDANGNIQWQKKLATNNSDNSVGLVEDDHGGAGFIVSGNIYRTGILPDAVITKLDLSGNVVWTKGYDFDSRSNWAGPVYKVPDGLIYYGRNDAGFDHEDARLAILKTDFNGNIIWNKEFVMPNCREGRMIVLPDGGFMWSQSPVPFDANSDVHLARVDAAGNVMWGKKYPRAGAQFLQGLVADGNYVFGVGLATSGSYNDVLLGKTDLNGKMGTCTSENVTVATRNVVATDLNFTWPATAALNLSTANTTYTLASMSPVENVLCSDGCPTVTVGNATVSEGAGNAVVQVCIPAPAATTLVYNYTTANGSAASGSDYTGGAGTVTIPAGQTCGTISIPITNDTEIESAEDFTVTVGTATGTVTINDDDQAGGNCSGVTITPGSNQITVTGVTAAVATVQVFNSNWATVFNQTYTNAPGTVVVPIAPGTYLVKVTFYTSGWGYICDKSENVTVVNNCPAGTICISNICPSQTVNLNDAYSIPNLPAGTTVSWHTGTPATDANRMTDQEAQNVSVSGTYYAAINISGAGCYSATIPVNVTIVACSGAAVTTSSSLVETGNVVQLKSVDQPAARSIMAFPNPFTRSLRVVIDSEKKERATITLTDLQGRQLKQMPVQLMPGSNTVLLDGLDQFPSGNYFLRINSDKGMKTLKVVRQQ